MHLLVICLVCRLGSRDNGLYAKCKLVCCKECLLYRKFSKPWLSLLCDEEVTFIYVSNNTLVWGKHDSQKIKAKCSETCLKWSPKGLTQWACSKKSLLEMFL